MPLPLLKLDDRSFTDLVDELRSAIPHHSQAWTNHNPSDPGIMFMELFAWLTENTIYRINRVTPASRVRFLELLGSIFQSAQPATIQLTITAKGLYRPHTLQRGQRIDAHTDRYGVSIPFEILEPVTLTPSIPVGVVSARQSLRVKDEYLGTGNGLPYQQFALKESAIVLPSEPFPQTPTLHVDGQPWLFRANFEKSCCNDKHFTIKPWLNALIVGDGKKGMWIPPRAKIELIYRTNPDEPRLVRDQWTNPFPKDVTQVFQLKHPVLRLDLQPRHEFEPIVQICGEPWQFRSQFMAFGKDAYDFTVEPWANVFRFGGNVVRGDEPVTHGKTPPKDAAILASYHHTLGARGNLPRGTTFTMQVELGPHVPDFVIDREFKITRFGEDRIDLAEARDQVYAILQPRWRTITSGDFQEVITADHPDVINVTPVVAGDLTSSALHSYRPSHVSAVLTPGERHKLVQESKWLGGQLQMSPDGRRLLAHEPRAAEVNGQAVQEEIARLWAMETKRRLLTFAVPRLQQASFSPDSRFLVTNDQDNIARLWQAEDGEAITFLHPTMHQVAWRSEQAEQAIVAVDGDGIILSWQLAGNEPPNTHTHANQADLIAISANGARIATVSDSSVITIGSTQDWIGAVATKHIAQVTLLAFSETGRWLVYADIDQVVWLYDTIEHELVGSYSVAAPITALAVNRTGELLAIATSDCVTLVWEITKQNFAATLPHSAPPHLLRFDQQERMFVTADGDGNVTLWALATSTIVANFSLDTIIYAVAIDAQQRYLVTASADQRVRVWNARNPVQDPITLAHGGPIYDLAFSPHNTMLATVGTEGAVRIWSLQESAAGKVTAHTDQLFSEPVTSYQFAPEQSYLVTLTQGKKAWLWEMAGGRLLAPLFGASAVHKAEFSADGRWLATIHEDHVVRLWEPETGQLLVGLTHPTAVDALWFSPTSTALATRDADGLIRLWQVQPNYRQLIKPELQGKPEILPYCKPIDRVEWSADGTRMLTWAACVLLWSTRTHQPLATLIKGDSAITIGPFAIDPTNQVVAGCYTSNDSGTDRHVLKLWNLRSGAQLAERHLPVAPCTIRFHPSGKRLLSISKDHRAWVWALRFRPGHDCKLDLKEQLAVPPAADGWLHEHGEWLATRQENLILVWDPMSGRLQSSFFHEHTDRPEVEQPAIESMSPTMPAGTVLVTRTERGAKEEAKTTIRVWDAGQIPAVDQLLKERKLIATQPHVTGVAFTDIWIGASVVRAGTTVQPETIQKMITAKLREFFHPHQGGPQNQGWPLGRAVYASEVFQIIEAIAGVDYVESLLLTTEPLDEDCDGSPLQTAAKPHAGRLFLAQQGLTQIDLETHHLVNCHVQPCYFPIIDAGTAAGRGQPRTREKAWAR